VITVGHSCCFSPLYPHQHHVQEYACSNRYKRGESPCLRFLVVELTRLAALDTLGQSSSLWSGRRPTASPASPLGPVRTPRRPALPRLRRQRRRGVRRSPSHFDIRGHASPAPAPVVDA
jgi:hypothetical protein